MTLSTNGAIQQFLSALIVGILGVILNLLTGGEVQTLLTQLLSHVPFAGFFIIPLVAALTNYVKHLIDQFTTPATPPAAP